MIVTFALFLSGRTVPAQVVGYDHETGFGLLRTNEPLKVRPLPFGKAAELEDRDPVLIASFGGAEMAAPAFVVARREFAGSWEYLLDQAIFTAPPHPAWSGAALVNREGKLVGVGSLIVGNAAGEAHPIVAEGISMAMQSAWLLCRRLIAQPDALACPHALAQIGRAYATDWDAAFAMRVRAAALFANLATRPRAARLLLPLVRRFPATLTLGTQLSGKTRVLVAAASSAVHPHCVSGGAGPATLANAEARR